MRYLITTSEHKPFITKWFEYENHWLPKINMVVYDLVKLVYTTDGTTWQDIEVDRL